MRPGEVRDEHVDGAGRGHDLAGLNGTGPRGRVQASDVPGAVAAAAAISATTAPPAPGAVAVLRDAPGGGTRARVRFPAVSSRVTQS